MFLKLPFAVSFSVIYADYVTLTVCSKGAKNLTSPYAIRTLLPVEYLMFFTLNTPPEGGFVGQKI